LFCILKYRSSMLKTNVKQHLLSKILVIVFDHHYGIKKWSQHRVIDSQVWPKQGTVIDGQTQRFLGRWRSCIVTNLQLQTGWIIRLCHANDTIHLYDMSVYHKCAYIQDMLTFHAILVNCFDLVLLLMSTHKLGVSWRSCW
jgi:hypothetical protein